MARSYVVYNVAATYGFRTFRIRKIETDRRNVYLLTPVARAGRERGLPSPTHLPSTHLPPFLSSHLTDLKGNESQMKALLQSVMISSNGSVK